jgi:hypothetical protein
MRRLAVTKDHVAAGCYNRMLKRGPIISLCNGRDIDQEWIAIVANRTEQRIEEILVDGRTDLRCKDAFEDIKRCFGR